MRIVFMGSAPFACPSLESIRSDEVAAVVTRPDRPKGRGMKLTACSVRQCAERLGLPVLTPEQVNSESSAASLRALAPDLGVVVAYGSILKKQLLDVFPLGCINVHASLLPKYRGAAPVQWAIANGENETGVTVMFINEKMDEGDIILQEAEAIDPEDTGGTLGAKLAGLGARLLASALDGLRGARARRIAQDHGKASFAPRLSKKDGRIDWTMPARIIHRRVRAFNPWPCCHCCVPLPGGGTRILRILKAGIEDAEGEPGTILDIDGGPLVGAGLGSLRLVEVQVEGKRAMSGAEYARGYRPGVGSRLE